MLILGHFQQLLKVAILLKVAAIVKRAVFN